MVEKLSSSSQYLAGLYTLLPPKDFTGDYACNNLGLFFSAQPIGSFDPSGSNLLRENPQVNADEVNKDYGVWKKTFGCFKAGEGEQYLTIGNFYDNDHTKVELTVPHYDQGSDFAFYGVDSVFEEEIKNPFIPNIFTPNGDALNEIGSKEYPFWLVVAYRCQPVGQAGLSIFRLQKYLDWR